MPRGLDLTATQTLSTARFRAILVYDDLHYPFDFIGDPGRIEPATTRLEGECSIQLSYGVIDFGFGCLRRLRWISWGRGRNGNCPRSFSVFLCCPVAG